MVIGAGIDFGLSQPEKRGVPVIGIVPGAVLTILLDRLEHFLHRAGNLRA